MRNSPCNPLGVSQGGRGLKRLEQGILSVPMHEPYRRPAGSPLSTRHTVGNVGEDDVNFAAQRCESLVVAVVAVGAVRRPSNWAQVPSRLTHQFGCSHRPQRVLKVVVQVHLLASHRG